MAGVRYEDGSHYRVYWINGQAFGLGGVKFLVSGMTVADEKIHLVGNDIEDTPMSVVKYWNGNKFTRITGNNIAFAHGIAVSDGDVYIVGYELERINGVNTQIIKYWKNGEEVVLSDGKHQLPSRLSIAVYKGDVYVAGRVDDLKGFGVVHYWKNEQHIELTDGKKQATAPALFVDGDDVYIAGSEDYVARYWKNGEGVMVGEGTMYSYSSAIFVTRTLGDQ